MKLALAALFSALALSAAADPLDPAAVAPGVYVIDSKETLVRYGTVHMGFSEFWGTFPGARGSLTFDPARIGASRLEVTVPVATLSTTNPELDAQLASKTFFDAAQFPVMRFISTEVQRTGDRTAEVTGNLTIHGVTRPVVLEVTFIGAGPNYFTKVATIGFRGEGRINRSDFGLGKFVPIVSDATTITISAAFEKD